MPGKGGARPGAGRPKGSPNNRRIDGERYARAIVEDPIVQAKLLEQAQAGVLPFVLMQMFFAYAYGKPAEVLESGDSDNPRSVTITF